MVSTSRNPLTNMTMQQRFLHTLETLSSQTGLTRLVIAFSGGVDSHVLLHLCAQSGHSLRAIHINHQLQSSAGDWQQHCQRTCDELAIPFSTYDVDATARPGDSQEEAARDARYQALLEHAETDELVLLAQHQQDQAETVILQLMRGAGAAGLSAMPVLRTRTNSAGEPITFCRPLLGESRQSIERYAESNGLQWVEDPSNQDVAIKRNAIRHDVLPVLQRHWPDAVAQLSTVASKQQENTKLIDELAQIDLALMRHEDVSQLDITALGRLARHRQFNVLRYWLSSMGSKPNKNCIQQIMHSLLTAQEDASPVVRWSAYEVRRFENRLYLLPQTPSVGEDYSLQWQDKTPLDIEPLGKTLSVIKPVASGLEPSLLEDSLTVMFRQGGEKIKPSGRHHHHSLKKLFQENNVPPWQRGRVPLLYRADELIAVCGFWLSDAHCVGKDETGWKPDISTDIRGG